MRTSHAAAALARIRRRKVRMRSWPAERRSSPRTGVTPCRNRKDRMQADSARLPSASPAASARPCCWAAGFIAARHGIDIGFSPADLTFHRCFWAGLVLLPLALRDGIADLNGIGWGRGIVLTILGGPGIAIVSYSGFLLVPLGHGGVIQPSCAALFGLLLATVVLQRAAAGAARDRRADHRRRARRDRRRGDHAPSARMASLGDLLFVLAGGFFATFGMLLRRWRSRRRAPPSSSAWCRSPSCRSTGCCSASTA